ncbi:hypothetical protein SAMN05660473_00013 [Arthrobacter sp. 49Tsu3.1M3]|nr:hypothetical protein SAMN05660473_00013 [Arthrobacter sp. 49Tsu3.1M3]
MTHLVRVDPGGPSLTPVGVAPRPRDCPNI